jgi:hypothetical protein
MSGFLPYILVLLALILYALRWLVNMASQRGKNRFKLDPDVLEAYLEKLKDPNLSKKERNRIEELLKKHYKDEETRHSHYSGDKKKKKKEKNKK